MEWLSPQDRDQDTSDGVLRAGCRFLNDRGSDRVTGNHQKSRWVAMSGNLEGAPVSIMVLCHREHPFQAKYRYLVTDAEPDAAWIESQ